MAVKTIPLSGIMPKEVASARSELRVMCAVSKQLAGYVVALKVRSCCACRMRCIAAALPS